MKAYTKVSEAMCDDSLKEDKSAQSRFVVSTSGQGPRSVYNLPGQPWNPVEHSYFPGLVCFLRDIRNS